MRNATNYLKQRECWWQLDTLRFLLFKWLKLLVLRQEVSCQMPLHLTQSVFLAFFLACLCCTFLFQANCISIPLCLANWKSTGSASTTLQKWNSKFSSITDKYYCLHTIPSCISLSCWQKFKIVLFGQTHTWATQCHLN